jgi:hypothetical protein
VASVSYLSDLKPKTDIAFFVICILVISMSGMSSGQGFFSYVLQKARIRHFGNRECMGLMRGTKQTEAICVPYFSSLLAYFSTPFPTES